MEPEPDQQVGAQPHAFPEDKHEEDVVGQHQSQHAGCEQRHAGVVAEIAGVAFHVALRVNLHHQADEGYDHDHHGRECVYQDADMDIEVAEHHPLDIVNQQHMFRRSYDRAHHPEGQGAGYADGADGYIAAQLVQLGEERPYDQPDAQEGQERQ